MLSVITRRSFRYLRPLSKINITGCVNCSSGNDINNNNKEKKNEKAINDVLGSIGTKYQIFRDEDATVIFDVNEEKFKTKPIEIYEEVYDEFEGLNLERGINGVYEINDLVEVLRRENGLNIFVASVPREIKYVDYICVVTGRSYRHMLAIAQFIRKLYKMKSNSEDIIPKIEGENSKEWIAMDLGNIALHIFSSEARLKYDLDSLWALGEEYDDECNKPDDPIVQLLQQHSVYLKDLEPADDNA